jgi:hypothetical protein
LAFKPKTACAKVNLLTAHLISPLGQALGFGPGQTGTIGLFSEYRQLASASGRTSFIDQKKNKS